MAASAFASRPLGDMYEEIREVYLGDSRPWILGFSGGKDSTCMVQMVWNALSALPAERLSKPVHVISSDTRVESPVVAGQIRESHAMMDRAAAGSGLPISTSIVRPPTEDTFWVCLLGKGYPAPTNLFRWCTDRLKVSNADRFVREQVSRYGEAVAVLGTRKDESGSTRQLMNMYEIENSRLSRHSKLAQTYVYTPLRDFTAQDVWNYLLQHKSPWGASNRDLLAMYRTANAAECPLVVDTSTPSCGGTRFGCWTCTVVESDESLRNTVENGAGWMEPLLELREELKATQEPARRRQVRQLKRRTGKMKLIDDARRGTFERRLRESEEAEDGAGAGGAESSEAGEGGGEGSGGGDDPYSKLVPGPYTMEFCAGFLERLLAAQEKVRRDGPDPAIELISDDEVREIQRIWRAERGDWRDTAYHTYERATGRRLAAPEEDMGAPGAAEQEVLEEVCRRRGVPALLVSRLLNAEHESQGTARRSGVYRRLNAVLAEEWREDMGEVIGDLERKKAARAELGGR